MKQKIEEGMRVRVARKPEHCFQGSRYEHVGLTGVAAERTFHCGVTSPCRGWFFPTEDWPQGQCFPEECLEIAEDKAPSGATERTCEMKLVRYTVQVKEKMEDEKVVEPRRMLLPANVKEAEEGQCAALWTDKTGPALREEQLKKHRDLIADIAWDQVEFVPFA